VTCADYPGRVPARTPGALSSAWSMADRIRSGADGGPAGHMAVFCNAAPGCRSVWYRPRHGPGGAAGRDGRAPLSRPVAHRIQAATGMRCVACYVLGPALNVCRPQCVSATRFRMS
jgi:hypothetical protein